MTELDGSHFVILDPSVRWCKLLLDNSRRRTLRSRIEYQHLRSVPDIHRAVRRNGDVARDDGWHGRQSLGSEIESKDVFTLKICLSWQVELRPVGRDCEAEKNA